MPIYEYQCEECGHQLEKLQRMSDEPLRDCPECKQAGLRKLVSAAAFKLKGTGWYETDFKDNSKPEKNKETGKKEPSKKAEPTTKSSTESKPAKSDGKAKAEK